MLPQKKVISQTAFNDPFPVPFTEATNVIFKDFIGNELGLALASSKDGLLFYGTIPSSFTNLDGGGGKTKEQETEKNGEESSCLRQKPLAKTSFEPQSCSAHFAGFVGLRS